MAELYCTQLKIAAFTASSGLPSQWEKVVRMSGLRWGDFSTVIDAK